MLELSATPRVAQASGKGQWLQHPGDVRGTDLDAAEMIKLPIQVEVRRWADWQSCLAARCSGWTRCSARPTAAAGETGRYIRPILLVQVERTGKDQRDAGFIHAEDAKRVSAAAGF
jgi:type III restriction enzyme